jgi:hypothetical protein
MYVFEPNGKVKAIPVTGRGRAQKIVMRRGFHILYNRLTDGGEFVSLMRRPPLIPRKIPGTYFC